MQELSFLSENDKDWAMRSRDRPAPEVDVIDLSMLFALSIVVSAARDGSSYRVLAVER